MQFWGELGFQNNRDHPELRSQERSIFITAFPLQNAGLMQHLLQISFIKREISVRRVLEREIMRFVSCINHSFLSFFSKCLFYLKRNLLAHRLWYLTGHWPPSHFRLLYLPLNISVSKDSNPLIFCSMILPSQMTLIVYAFQMN